MKKKKKDTVNKPLYLLVNILFGFLCTPIFAFLFKWHGVLGTHSSMSLFGVFSILKSSVNKASTLLYPIQSGCGPYIPLCHMQSRAPEAGGRKSRFPGEQRGVPLQ